MNRIGTVDIKTSRLKLHKECSGNLLSNKVWEMFSQDVHHCPFCDIWHHANALWYWP